MNQASGILTESYGSNGSDFEEIVRMQELVIKFELGLAKSLKNNNIAVAKIKSIK